MNNNRVNEIMASMKSFGKEKYQKSEVLDEMFALQREIVALTFNEDHASMANLKIWDVERHLEQLNKDCGNVADAELQKFEEGSKVLCNMIKAEISGRRGEAKAFRTLQFIRKNNIVLENIELSDGDLRTELDAVVITPEGATIIEVKNTSKNIFIDENGEYFRTGEFLKKDCNIAEKMTLKEELLHRALCSEGIAPIKIQSIIVFTDNRIEVQNKYPYVKTCFLNQLVHSVESFASDRQLTYEEMLQAAELIKTAESKVEYSFEFDVRQYKMDFAILMSTLEDASVNSEEEPVLEAVNEEVPEEMTKESFKEAVMRIFESRIVRLVGSAAIGAAVSLITTGVVEAIRK